LARVVDLKDFCGKIELALAEFDVSISELDR
jgi:hypothetical protein